MNMYGMLGLNEVDYPHSMFPAQGVTHELGLTVPGLSLMCGKAEIWNQDYSIMGWTCGNGMASARDVAKFYWDFLGPNRHLVSEDRVIEMMNFTFCDKGWAAPYLMYGGGLMPSAVAPWKDYPPVNNTLNFGHGGHTYGF